MATYKNVLLVEDDAIARMVCERIMKLNGFADNVVMYDNAEAALRFLSSVKSENFPSVIFLDVNMPVLNAWDFLEEFAKVKTNPVQSPLIYLLSSSINPLDKEKASRYPLVQDFIEKPLKKEMLEKITAEAFAS